MSCNTHKCHTQQAVQFDHDLVVATEVLHVLAGKIRHWHGKLVVALHPLKLEVMQALPAAHARALHVVSNTAVSSGLCLQEELDISAQDAGGCTALPQAAKCQHLEVVHVLLAAGADAGRPDRLGRIPLHHAAELADVEMFVALYGQSGATEAELKVAWVA